MSGSAGEEPDDAWLVFPATALTNAGAFQIVHVVPIIVWCDSIPSSSYNAHGDSIWRFSHISQVEYNSEVVCAYGTASVSWVFSLWIDANSPMIDVRFPGEYIWEDIRPQRSCWCHAPTTCFLQSFWHESMLPVRGFEQKDQPYPCKRPLRDLLLKEQGIV